MGEHFEGPGGTNYAKLGTCESFYYTREHDAKVLRAQFPQGYEGDASNWDWVFKTDGNGAMFRFPWADEPEFTDLVSTIDAIAGAGFQDHAKERLIVPNELAAEQPHKTVAIHTQALGKLGDWPWSGNIFVPCPVLLANVPYNDQDAQDEALAARQASRSNGEVPGGYALYGMRYRPTGRYTVFQCVYCDTLSGLSQLAIEAGEWQGDPTNYERIDAAVHMADLDLDSLTG